MGSVPGYEGTGDGVGDGVGLGVGLASTSNGMVVNTVFGVDESAAVTDGKL